MNSDSDIFAGDFAASVDKFIAKLEEILKTLETLEGPKLPVD